MKLWQIVAITLVGVALGALKPGLLAHAFSPVTLYVLLPGLLFEAAWNLNARAVRRQWRAISLLAVAGVAISALTVAVALWIVHIPFAVALLAGAILSATDPIAVIAVFRRTRVPVLLRTIVEGESLFNDAIAVVLYRALVVALASGATAGTLVGIALVSIVGSFAGVIGGAACALLVALFVRNARNAVAQSLATIIGAYGSYLLVDALHASGIFATIAFGFTLRFVERRFLSVDVADAVEHFWERIAIAANVVVFLLVGAALDISLVRIAPAFVVATIVGVALARYLIPLLLVSERYPRAWLDVIRVAGLRGALSLALAIALPASIPFRQEIVVATFAVAIATIISSVVTVPPTVARVARR